MHNKFLQWSKDLHNIAQKGLTYTKDPYDKKRFETINKIASEILSTEVNISKDKIYEIFDKEYGYPTPKIGVGAAIFKDNKIMLVQESDNKKWSLPGGWVDVGDTPSEAIIKEVQEETHLSVEVIKLAAIIYRNRHIKIPIWPSLYRCLFLCKIISGTAKPDNIETINVEFFNEDSLPPLSLDRTTKKQISLMFKHHNNLELPTYYD